jgi:hypothetical protein
MASFGRVRQVEAGGQPELGYSIAITKTGSGRVLYVTPCAKMGTKNKAHAIKHTCSKTHVNVEFIHTGEIGADESVLARTSKDVQAAEELFVCYGPKDSIRFFDQHPCLCHQSSA